MTGMAERRLIVSADDFGLSEEINEAIEIAHRDGLLSTASLMVAGPASVDAIRRARNLPDLRVGLHLVTIEGDATLPPAAISAIADHHGAFGTDQLDLGLRYFFSPAARRALGREIEAQYRAFSYSGLSLDHANAHKHMHLHPTIGRLLIEKGLNYGLKYVRTPFEPPGPIAGSDTPPDTFGAFALRRWTSVLRRQIHRAGLGTNDWCFGLAWTGHMSTERVSRLATRLPAGLSEIYFHPGMAKNARVAAVMPDYDHRGEFDALVSTEFRSAVTNNAVMLSDWAGSAV